MLMGRDPDMPSFSEAWRGEAGRGWMWWTRGSSFIITFLITAGGFQIMGVHP